MKTGYCLQGDHDQCKMPHCTCRCHRSDAEPALSESEKRAEDWSE